MRFQFNFLAKNDARLCPKVDGVIACDVRGGTKVPIHADIQTRNKWGKDRVLGVRLAGNGARFLPSCIQVARGLLISKIFFDLTSSSRLQRKLLQR